jgi:SAM-dependent methyltransferase
MAGNTTNLYAGSAGHYPIGRMPYPPAIADVLGLEGSERLLDVGCGPGSLTLVLAPRLRAAVGVDADAGMLAEAARQAARAGAANITWRRLRAEELPADLGRFDLVTFAQSFHWMDHARVAAAVRTMLAPGGRCVLVGATTHRGDASDDRLPHPRPPHEAIAALVESYVGPALKGTPWQDDDIRAAGFTGPERIEVDAGGVVTRSADEIVASVFSLSYAAPERFGAALPRFEADLRALLAATSPAGAFSERRREIALDVWR